MTDPAALSTLVISLGVAAAMIGAHQIVSPPCPKCGARSWDKYNDLAYWRCNRCSEWVDWR